MITVIESPIFTKLWPDYWSEDERGNFSAWIAENPDAGDVVPGSGGIRKIRWTRKGQGKRGGVRVIYFTAPHLPKDYFGCLLFMQNQTKKIFQLTFSEH